MENIMIGTFSLYELFAYFYIYSFLGWVTEVAFHAITQGKFVNRGFLNGPVCPIYGTGVVLVLLILGDYRDNAWAVFLVGVLLPTAIELVTGWAMDKLFHNKWWDYSDRKCNLGGYICLEFSLLWGLAVLFVIEVIHPFIAKFADLFAGTAGTVLCILCTVALIADLVLTVLQVAKLNKKLAEIDAAVKAMRLGSDFIGEKVASVTLAAKKGVDKAKERYGDRAAEVKEEIGEKYAETKAAAAEKWEETVQKLLDKTPKRLLRAFPRLLSRNHPDALPLVRKTLGKKEREKSAEEQAEKDDNE